MMQVSVINIEWYLFEFNQDVIKTLSKETDFGIYQIYGEHPAYGKDALLYIGQAGRFSDRLSKRFEFMESCANPLTIRIGRFVNSEQKDNENLDIKDKNLLLNVAEQILIKTHAPAFNQVHNKGLFNSEGIDGKHYIILNWHNYGVLLPEVSTLRFSYRFWMFDNPIK